MRDTPSSIADQLVTYQQASHLYGISVDTLRMWRYRGHLPQATNKNGRPLRRGRQPLFRLVDIARAEKATRQRARRHIPTPT